MTFNCLRGEGGGKGDVRYVAACQDSLSLDSLYAPVFPASHSENESEDIRLLLLEQLFHVLVGTHFALIRYTTQRSKKKKKRGMEFLPPSPSIPLVFSSIFKMFILRFEYGLIWLLTGGGGMSSSLTPQPL